MIKTAKEERSPYLYISGPCPGFKNRLGGFNPQVVFILTSFFIKYIIFYFYEISISPRCVVVLNRYQWRILNLKLGEVIYFFIYSKGS